MLQHLTDCFGTAPSISSQTLTSSPKHPKQLDTRPKPFEILRYKINIPNASLKLPKASASWLFHGKLPKPKEHHVITLQHPELVSPQSNGSLHLPMRCKPLGYACSSSPPAKVIAQTYVCPSSTSTAAPAEKKFSELVAFGKTFPTLPRHRHNSRREPSVTLTLSLTAQISLRMETPSN